MADPNPDAKAELIQILRGQISLKDQRIAELECQLHDAARLLDDHERLLARLVQRRVPRVPSLAAPAPAADQPPAPQQDGSRPADRPPVPLPDLGPQIQVIASAVVAAAASRRPEPADPEEHEITARFDRDELRAGHTALGRARERIAALFGARRSRGSVG